MVDQTENKTGLKKNRPRAQKCFMNIQLQLYSSIILAPRVTGQKEQVSSDGSSTISSSRKTSRQTPDTPTRCYIQQLVVVLALYKPREIACRKRASTGERRNRMDGGSTPLLLLSNDG